MLSFGHQQARKHPSFHWGNLAQEVQTGYNWWNQCCIKKQKSLADDSDTQAVVYFLRVGEMCVDPPLPILKGADGWCRPWRREIDRTSSGNCCCSLTGIKKCSPVNPARNFLLIQKCQFIFKPVGPANKKREHVFKESVCCLRGFANRQGHRGKGAS